MEIVKWLNLNQGFVMAVLTFVYVVATVLILLKNREVVQEMRVTREQQLRANIVVSFEARRKGLLCFVLRNLGSTAANQLNISISEDFIKRLEDREQEKFRRLKSVSLTIVPNQEIIYVAGGTRAFKRIAGAELAGVVSYEDVFGGNQSERFSIQPESYEGSLLYGPGLDELTTIIDKGLAEIASRMGK